MSPRPVYSKEDALYIRDLMANDQFRSRLDRSWALDDVVEAFRYVDTGMKFGNVVIRISRND